MVGSLPPRRRSTYDHWMKATLWILCLPLLGANGWRASNVDAGLTVRSIESGWVAYGDPATRTFSNLGEGAWAAMSVGYLRFNWSELEPKEGHFQFQKLNAALESCRLRGKGFAFRVFCANYYGKRNSSQATPLWVFQAGAKGAVAYPGGAMVPTWDDPVFLDKIGAFHRALAKEYDGAPGLRFIDLGSYGNWGENHLGELSAVQRPLTADAFLNAHARPFRNCFRRTPVALCSKYDDSKNEVFSGGDPEDCRRLFATLASEGYRLRWDGAVQRNMSAGKPLGLAAAGSPRILEWCFALGETTAKVGWQDWLIRDISEGEASYAGMGLFREDPECFAAQFPDVVRTGKEMLGWSLAVRPPEPSEGPLTLRLQKRGVARIPPTVTVKAAFLGADNFVLGEFPIDVTNLSSMNLGDQIMVNLTPPMEEPRGSRALAIGFRSAGGPDILIEGTQQMPSSWLIYGVKP